MSIRQINVLAPAAAGAVQPLQRWGRLYGSSPGLVLAEAASRLTVPLLVVAPSARDAERLTAELRFYLTDPGLPVLAFPDWETLPYDLFSPHQDIISERLATLSRIYDLKRGIVVLSAATLMQRLAPREYVLGGTLLLETGTRLDLESLRQRLAAAGYASVSQVMEHGEFALRGSLLDVFPMGSPVPYRIDLFDDEIESIRVFDPETQLSKDTLAELTLLPAREFPLHEDGIRAFRQRYRARIEGDPQRSSIYRDVSDGIASGGIEYYLPLFFDATASFFDYLPLDSVITGVDDTASAVTQAWEQIAERHEQRRHDIERPILKPDELWLTPKAVALGIAAHPRIELQGFEHSESSAVNFPTAAPPSLRIESRAEEPAEKLLAFLRSFSGRVLFAAESAGRREYLSELLGRRDLKPADRKSVV